MKVACIQPKINKDRTECYSEIDEILKEKQMIVFPDGWTILKIICANMCQHLCESVTSVLICGKLLKQNKYGSRTLLD